MNTMKIGMGSGEIRFPMALFPMEGFCGIHDDPKVRVMLLESNIRFAIVSCEIVMLPKPLIEECQKMIEKITGTPKENVWIHMTHAISTPHMPGDVPFPPPVDNGVPVEEKRRMYSAVIVDAVEAAAKEAFANKQDAVLRVAKGNCDINVNRDVLTPHGWWVGNGSNGPSNKEMTVLCADTPDGKPVGFLISYGIKPCALDNSGIMSGTRQVSADLTGVASKILEDKYGVPAMFCMSAAGDQIPREMALYERVDNEGRPQYVDQGVEKGFEFVQRLGAAMGETAVAIAENEGTAVDTTMETKSTAFSWPCKGRARMMPTKEIAYVAEREEMVDVSTLKIGNVAFIAAKPEINTVTEQQLQAASPYETTLLISMVNGGMKYMPEKEAYEQVKWEAQSAMLLPGAAEKFVETAISLLQG